MMMIKLNDVSNNGDFFSWKSKLMTNLLMVFIGLFDAIYLNDKGSFLNDDQFSGTLCNTSIQKKNFCMKILWHGVGGLKIWFSVIYELLLRHGCSMVARVPYSKIVKSFKALKSSRSHQFLTSIRYPEKIP